MDSATALVESYLHANGFFTITEYQVIEAMEDGDYRTATDIDVMAVRFPGAGLLIPRKGRRPEHDILVYEPDPVLRTTNDRVDMLIAEVKEGRAELNRGARNPGVLRAVLTRFGACTSNYSGEIVEGLLRDGQAISRSGPRVRLMAFGSLPPDRQRSPYEVITLGHIVGFMQDILREHWKVAQNMQFKRPGVAFLGVLEKIRRAESQAPADSSQH